jgi:hypothetical protein
MPSSVIFSTTGVVVGIVLIVAVVVAVAILALFVVVIVNGTASAIWIKIVIIKNIFGKVI